MNVNNEIMIASGLHQFQHGLITAIDRSTTIPFAHVTLRAKSGEYLKRSGAYVPLKYCVEIGEECANAVRAAAKMARKMRRAAAKEQVAAAPAPTGKELAWK